MLKMGQSILPILILTTVALSSSDVLPILFNKDHVQPYNLDDHHDNTFSDRNIHSDTTNNIFYNKRTSQDYLTLPTIKEIKAMYPDPNNRDVEDMAQDINKEQNYDDEGYRKEQWHNYPRQLDRLHSTRYRVVNADKLMSDKGDGESINGDFDDLITDEIIFDNGDGNSNIYDTIIAATNPYLILKVQLSYLRDEGNNDINDYSDVVPLSSEDEVRKEKDNVLLTDTEPVPNIIKVKREKSITDQDNEVSDDQLFDTDNGNPDRRTVKKRIFSLWSRLQSLSHRGHELHHRRHLHAFYESPDTNRNGIVTAQTRATFIRPPGSPLRWG